MTEITIDAGTLTANEETRTATGLLLPYGEEGRTNLGRVKVKAGSIEIPADMTGLAVNIDHDREQPVAGFLAAAHTPQGAVSTVMFARTPEGDQALADALSGKRKHLSIEAKGIKIRDGEIVSGRLFAAALVEKPAFPSATLMAAAADTTEPVVEEHDFTDPETGAEQHET